VPTEPLTKEALPYEDTTSSGLYYEDKVPAGSGLLIFAVAMMAIAGTWAMIEGVAAIVNSKVFADDAVFVFSDLNAWGWIVLVLGGLMVFAAFTVFTGSQFARWFGIAVAGVNALGQLFFIEAYPMWSLALLVADVVIIYALAMCAGPKLKLF
jgi:hypothetical protein